MTLGLSFSELLELVRKNQITSIVSNSKKVVPGSVFVAIPGFAVDGHRFVPEALASGARFVVVERDLGLTNQVVVPSSRKALAALSHSFYDNPSHKLNLIGVTGTNGKTSTVFMLHHVLGHRTGMFSTVKTIVGTTEIPQDRTTPEVVEIDELLSQMVERGAEYAVMEVSSHSVVLDRVLGLRFKGGVFTNLTQDHLDFHKTMEEYAKAKRAFFLSMSEDSAAAFNSDDPSATFMKGGFKGRVVDFGVRSGEVRAKNIETSPTSISYDLAIGERTWKFQLPIGGDYNVYNSLGVLAILHGLEFDIDEAVEKFASFPGVPGRFEKVDLGQEFAVIVDYAHTPDGLKNVLSSARRQIKERGNLIVVFGCGGDRDRTKRPLMGAEASIWADRIIVTSDNPRTEDPNAIINDIVSGIKDKPYEVEPDRRKAILTALSMAKAGDMVVIAGKGHEDYQDINGVKHHFDDREVAREGLIFIGKNQR